MHTYTSNSLELCPSSNSWFQEFSTVVRHLSPVPAPNRSDGMHQISIEEMKAIVPDNDLVVAEQIHEVESPAPFAKINHVHVYVIEERPQHSRSVGITYLGTLDS